MVVCIASLLSGATYQDGVKLYDSKDYKKAFDVWQELCEQNSGESCGAIGVLYYSGYGVKKDFVNAINYQKRGCELNDATSCSWAGAMYELGQGTEQNVKMARDFYDRACKFGEENGCVDRDRLDGKGPKADYKPHF